MSLFLKVELSWVELADQLGGRWFSSWFSQMGCLCLCSLKLTVELSSDQDGLTLPNWQAAGNNEQKPLCVWIFFLLSSSSIQTLDGCVGFTNTKRGELTGPPKRFEWLPWLPPRKVVIGPTKRSQVVLVGYRGFQVGVGGLRWSKPRTPRCSQVAQLGLRLNGWLGLVPPKEGSSW